MLENSVLATFEKEGQKFQILVDAKKVYDYLEGEKVPVSSLLLAPDVFKDPEKGERHKDETLQKVFKTMDTTQIAEFILKNGEVQLTTDQRRKMVEAKRKKIIALIARMAMDAQTKLPIPQLRIELALEKIRINVDPFKDAESQIDPIISALRIHLPLRIEKQSFALRVPAEYAFKVYGYIKEYNPERMEYDNKGDLYAKLTLYAGVKAEFLDTLANRTAGNFDVKEM